MRLLLDNALPSGIEEMLRLPQVCRASGLSRPHLYALIKSGEFPAPVKVGTRAIAWPASVIRKWQQDRIAA